MGQSLSFEPAGNVRSVADLPVLLLVGLTGVGKSSFARELGWPLLPNRRELVDRYVLPRLGADPKGLDRGERFALTARWRERHPGGLAEALAAAYTEPAWPLVFDGLRGEAEVSYARRRFPLAHFVVLEAPARVRLERLLGRGDAFDRVRAAAAGEPRLGRLAAGVVSESELARLESQYPPGLLAEKLAIIAAEQRNYHPDGPRRALLGCRRALFIDTTKASPAAAARKAQEWLEAHG